jgi:hypothetical protein
MEAECIIGNEIHKFKVNDNFTEVTPGGTPPNPYVGGMQGGADAIYDYYKIIDIQNDGNGGSNLICDVGGYDSHNSKVIWGISQRIYPTTLLCDMLQMGRIKLGDDIPDPSIFMQVIKGGTTKKRRFTKSKKSKRSKQSKRSKKTKSKSRTRRGGRRSRRVRRIKCKSRR